MALSCSPPANMHHVNQITKSVLEITRSILLPLCSRLLYKDHRVARNGRRHPHPKTQDQKKQKKRGRRGGAVRRSFVVIFVITRVAKKKKTGSRKNTASRLSPAAVQKQQKNWNE